MTAEPPLKPRFIGIVLEQRLSSNINVKEISGMGTTMPGPEWPFQDRRDALRWLLLWLQEAEFDQFLDPARSIALHAQRLIVRVGIPVVRAVQQHEVDDAQHFVGQSDDGALVSSANNEALELGAQGALGTTGGVGAFAEDPADIGIALAGSPTFAFPGGFIVPGAQAGPGSQSISASEDAHVVPDLDQQQSGSHHIDTRQGLQELQGVLLRL